MQTVDAGDLPLDQLIDALLAPTALSELLPINSVACFVLARQAEMPDFFERLIHNVHTIDGTLRDHVEFVVFYGIAPSLVVKHHGDHGKAYRYRLPDIAFSSGLRPRLSHRINWIPEFASVLTDEVRWEPASPIVGRTARTTEAAVSLIKERFGIAEACLPCLVFVDAGNLDAPVIVPLVAKDAVRALYTNVLAPLSDEFSKFERLWSELAIIHKFREPVEKARRSADALDAEKLKLTIQLTAARAALKNLAADRSGRRHRIEALHLERAQLRQADCTFRRAKLLEQRRALLPADHPVRSTIKPHLLHKAELQRLIYESTDESYQKRLQKFLDKDDNRINSLVGKAIVPTRRRLNEIEKEFREIGAPRGDLEVIESVAANQLCLVDKRLANVKSRLATDEPQLMDALKGVEREIEMLRADGVEETLISERTYGARAVVSFMSAAGLLGERNRATSKKVEMLKILALTSSPPDGTPLDLEEELRAIGEQLRGARHRKRIVLIPGPAVRPDDLVRLLSEHKPQIVHFSGHGIAEGIVLRGDSGKGTLARNEALARLFQNRGVRLVVLNSCYSQAQAEAIAKAGPVVLGTSDAVYDEAARRFSAVFYRSIANGCSIGEAFRDGRDTVDLHNLPDVYRMVGDPSVVLI